MRFWLLLPALTGMLMVQAQVTPFSYQIQKQVTAQRGAVVSAHPLASQAGVWVLKQGGNAFDAAIATQLALAVVYPGAGNLGGGGFLLAVQPGGNTVALDYREVAPAAAHRDMYLDSNGNPQTNLSQFGHKAAGVPGTVSGLFAAHRYARLPFRTLISPAIELAQNGFIITAAEARNLNQAMGTFIQHSTRNSAFIRYGGWKAGDTLVQPELAATLRRIREKGAKGFYEGTTAQLLVAEMSRGGGLITLQDLKNYRTAERKAMSSSYRGHTIIGMPLVSSGGILLQQMLGMIEPYPIGSWGFQSPQAVQLMVEAARRAFADRAEFLGDADFVKVPVAQLTHASYLQQRMADFVPGKAGSSATTGHGKPLAESEETTHLSVVDADGNAVAVTTTLNGNYGCRTVVGGAGFLLNNEMDDFSIKPGVPNMYGALGTEANAIAPGKRMLSSMTPTIVLKDGAPLLVLGTPGGTTIPMQVFQVVVNLVDFQLPLTDAVWKPRFHHQWKPDLVMLERTIPDALRTALRAMGYETMDRDAIGRFEAIRITVKNNQRQVEAVGDQRGDDSAAGY